MIDHTELPLYSIQATHKCIVCGAEWRFNPEWVTPSGRTFGPSWSVKSLKHGDCCETGAMDMIMIPLDSEVYES